MSHPAKRFRHVPNATLWFQPKRQGIPQPLKYGIERVELLSLLSITCSNPSSTPS